MKRIMLSQGKFALVDDDDFERVNAFKWSAAKMQHGNGRDHWYAKRSIVHDGTSWTVYLHRFILGLPDGLLVDHRDGNGLNCTKANMRFANFTQNSWNQRVSINSSSGFKCVTKTKLGFRAQMNIDRRIRVIGTFPTAEEAARVADVAMVHFHGDFARTNYQTLEPSAIATFTEWLNGTRFRLGKNPNTKLTADDVRVIRARYAAGDVLMKTIAEEYGVCYAAVAHAIAGRTFKHVTDVPAMTDDLRGFTSVQRWDGKRNLTDDQVREARRLYATGKFSMRQLAEDIGAKEGTLQCAVNGHSYRHITDVPPVLRRDITISSGVAA